VAVFPTMAGSHIFLTCFDWITPFRPDFRKSTWRLKLPVWPISN
jgi:hypothetical protein